VADIPPPTHDELVANANIDKQLRIDQANDYMNSKGIPAKAAMGRLKDSEKEQYNACWIISLMNWRLLIPHQRRISPPIPPAEK
jgi:hypothetical protein